HLRDHAHPAAAELSSLIRVVAEQGDLRHSERLQHLRRGDIAALVLTVTEREVCLVGVQPHVLERVSVELGVETYAASLLSQVQQEAPGLGDSLDGFPQLRPAVAALAAEHVAGKTLAMGADKRCPPVLAQGAK